MWGIVVIFVFYFISKVNIINYYYLSTFTCLLSQSQLHYLSNVHNWIAIIKALSLHNKASFYLLEKSLFTGKNSIEAFSELAFDQ